MYSAFQSNAFQRNAFQIVAESESPPVVVGGGGGGPVSYWANYRNNLKNIAKAAEARLYPQIEEMQLEEEVQQAIDEVVFDLRTALEEQSQELHLYLDKLLLKLDEIKKEAIMREQEDEFAILMVVV